MLCGGVGSEPSKWGHFPLGPAARNVKRTYHWPIIGRCHPIYLSYLNYHTSLSQVRNTNCNWHMVSCLINSHVILCGVVTSNQPRCHGAASAALEGHRSVVPCLFGHNCSAQCYKRHVRDFNLDSCAVDNRGCACFMSVRLAVDVCSVRMVIQIR